MPRYMTIDKITLEGNTPREVVFDLCLKSKGKRKDPNKYMLLVRRWCKQYSGAVIRTQSYEAFIDDLVANEFLQPIN